jgi:hypothetical protein
MKFNDAKHTFTVNILGQHTKNSYMGTFTVKCLLSPLEEIAADKRYRDLLGQNSHLAQEHIRQQAFGLAQLEQRVIEMPPFWENPVLPGGHIEDPNVLMEILDVAILAQENYIKEKEDELKERQKRLTKAIKKKKIAKEPDPDEEQVEVEDELMEHEIE